MAHKEYYDSKGNEIPSVTQILKVLNKPAVIEWANYLGFHKINYKQLLDEKADIGTYVHERIEKYFNKKDPKEEKEILDLKIKKQVDSLFDLFLDWEKSIKPIPIEIESSYTNSRFGGTIDCILEINKEIVLIDFKTSKKPYPSHFLQLGGYLILIEDNNKELYDKIAYVQIISLGKGLKIETKFIDEMIKYKEAFKSVFDIYLYWKNILKEDWNEFI